MSLVAFSSFTFASSVSPGQSAMVTSVRLSVFIVFMVVVGYC